MDAAAWLLDFNLEPSNLVANCLAAEFAELTFGRIAFQMGDCDREVTVGGEESTTMESAENSDVGLGFSFGPEASCAATSALANADLKTEWLLESRNLIKQYDNGEKPKRVLVKRVRNWFTREWDRLWASGVPWWKEFALSEQQELLGLRVRFQEIWNASRHK
jgi:hypothetical protein